MTSTSPASMGGPLSEAERRRNQHCMNCGDTRGGPMGHETSECTYDSSIITAVRGALKPSHRLVLGRLVHDAQQDTYPLADADDSGGPYIVQGCVVNSAPQIQDAVRTIWKRVPTLLDELQAKRDEVKHLRTKAESLLTQNGVLVTEVRFQAERADSFRSERDAATARVGVLEGQLATAREELDSLELIAAPHRMTADQRERYRRHASWEGAEHYLKQAEAAARKWQREADWLREFRDTRKAETEAGTWPPPGDFGCCAEHPAKALGLDGGGSDA